MNATKQIRNYVAAQEAAVAAHQQIIKRLDAAAEIITNVKRKKFYSDTLPESLAWIHIYRRPGVSVTLTGRDASPLEIIHEGKTWRIARVFVFGSTWDIARATRQALYAQRLEMWTGEYRSAHRLVSHAEKLLAVEIDKINAAAKRKVDETTRKHRAEVSTATWTLDVRGRQLERLNQYLSAKQ